MKNVKLVFLAMLVCSFVAVAACGSTPSKGSKDTASGSAAPAGSAGPAGSAAPSGGGKTYIMKFATATTNDTQVHVMEVFKKTAEAKSNGKLKVELYPSSQLGSNDQMLQMVTAGNIQAVIQPTAFLGGFNELMTVVDIPFLWPDVTKAAGYLNGEGGKVFQPSLDKLGLTALRYYEYGPRLILLKSKVEKAADFKGKKVRVMGAPVLVDQINTFGGAGVAMGVPELFTALQQGTIDGLESGANFFYSGKYFESAKFLLMEPKNSLLVSPIMMNTAWFKSLTPELQKVVTDTAAEITDDATKFARDADAKAIDEMKKAGVTVIEPTPEFHQALLDSAKTVIPKFEAKVAGSKEVIEKIQADMKK